MVELLAYIALGISLLSMNMKRMLHLRIFHALSSLLYGIYGTYIDSLPLIVGGALFVIIHLYHIVRALKKVR
ncbi:MAG: YgjV family protein [Flavobacteriales bacterium]|nr:YgjV family protein [Flavobacteriales bacterium]